MSCMYCLTAHRRGRFWFCNRCGRLMLLCPTPAHGVCPPDTDGQPADGEERGGRSHDSERSLLEALRRLKLSQEAEAAVRPDHSRQLESDLPDAVVLDLDAARRVREGRTF
jgi:hypothetical protein